MKAVLFRRFGGTDVLEWTETEKPQPKRDENSHSKGFIEEPRAGGLSRAPYRLQMGDRGEGAPVPQVDGDDGSRLGEPVALS